MQGNDVEILSEDIYPARWNLEGYDIMDSSAIDLYTILSMLL